MAKYVLRLKNDLQPWMILKKQKGAKIVFLCFYARVYIFGVELNP